MRWLAIAVAFITLSGCITERKCSLKYPPRTYIDSVYTEREVISYVVDTVFIELPPICIERYVDIKDTLRLKGAYSSAQSWASGGKLFGLLKEGEMPVKIEYKKEYVDRVKEVVKSEEKIVEVKYTPKIYKVLSLLGVIACFYAIFRVYLSLR